MNCVKCKCGASEKNFLHLSEKDLPEGWEGECCIVVVPETPTIPEITEEPKPSGKRRGKSTSGKAE